MTTIRKVYKGMSKEINMVHTVKGFAQKRETENEDMSNLESYMGGKFVDKEDDPFIIHKGYPIRVIASGGTSIGIYRGVTKGGYLVLYPTLTYEENLETGESKPKYEDCRPEQINVSFIGGVRPVSKEHYRKMCKLPDPSKRGVDLRYC